MGIDSEIEKCVFLSFVNQEAGRPFWQLPIQTMLTSCGAACLQCPHDALRELVRFTCPVRVRHRRDDGLALEHIAKCDESIADVVAAPWSRSRSGVTDGVTTTIDDRNLAELEVGIGAAQKVKHLGSRMALAQEPQAKRLEGRIDEGLGRKRSDSRGDRRTFGSHRQ
jgi:hypothetical protein